LEGQLGLQIGGTQFDSQPATTLERLEKHVK